MKSVAAPTVQPRSFFDGSNEGNLTSNSHLKMAKKRFNLKSHLCILWSELLETQYIVPIYTETDTEIVQSWEIKEMEMIADENTENSVEVE